MTITLELNGKAMKLLDQFAHFSEMDPDSMADVLGYDPDNLAIGAAELIRSINRAKK